MNKLLIAFLLVLVFPMISLAQGGAYNSIVLGPNVAVIAGAQITVCSYGSTVANCNANRVTVYTDATLSTPATNPITADGSGNFVVYAPSGNYNYVVSGSENSAIYAIRFHHWLRARLNGDWMRFYRQCADCSAIFPLHAAQCRQQCRGWPI